MPRNNVLSGIYLALTQKMLWTFGIYCSCKATFSSKLSQFYTEPEFAGPVQSHFSPPNFLGKSGWGRLMGDVRLDYFCPTFSQRLFPLHYTTCRVVVFLQFPFRNTFPDDVHLSPFHTTQSALLLVWVILSHASEKEAWEREIEGIPLPPGKEIIAQSALCCRGFQFMVLEGIFLKGRIRISWLTNNRKWTLISLLWCN